MIRWITDYLGTASFAYAARQAEHAMIVDVRDLVDKGGNLPGLARTKIDEALARVRSGQKVVICCDYGMSRSNAVAAGVLALAEELPFSDAVRTVCRTTSEQAINIEVLAAVRDAVQRDSSAAETSEQRSPRVLITGGSGCIGQALRKRLSAELVVAAPSRAEVDLLAGAVDLDLWLKDRGIDIVVHLANPRVYSTNRAMGDMLVMLKNVADACCQNRVRLICLSEWEIYAGYRSNSLLAAETLPPLPAGIYGQAKHLCEILLELCRVQKGLDCVVLRSCPIYGPACERPKFIWNFLDKARRGEKIVAHRYRNGFPCLDLLHIDDLVDLLVQVIDRPISGDFNVGSGRNWSTTQVAAMIVERLGSLSAIDHHDIQGYAPNIIMDSARAARLLGWHAKIDFADGLNQFLAAADVRQGASAA